MAQLVKKAIQSNAVDGGSIRLNNNQALRARNFANTTDIEIIKLDALDGLNLNTGPTTDSTSSGNINLLSGTTEDGAAISGSINLETGSVLTGSDSLLTGAISLKTGNTSDVGGVRPSGGLLFTTGTTQNGTSGAINLETGESLGSGPSSTSISGGILLKSGNVHGGNASGSVDLQSGSNPDGTGNSGSISLNSGAVDSGSSGPVSISTGGSNSAATGDISLMTGSGVQSGNINLITGDTFSSTQSGSINIATGGTTADSGNITIYSGLSELGSGDVEFGSGVTTTTGNSGNVLITSGEVTGTGDSGDLQFRSGDAGDGDSGDISFIAGAATGTRGQFNVEASFIGLFNADSSGSIALSSSDITLSSPGIIMREQFNAGAWVQERILISEALSGGEASPTVVSAGLRLDWDSGECMLEFDYVLTDLTTNDRRYGKMIAIISNEANPTVAFSDALGIQTAAIPYVFSASVTGNIATIEYTSVGANNASIVGIMRREFGS